MRISFIYLFFAFLAFLSASAGPRLYLTGSEQDAAVSPQPGLLLMGGGGDVDDAMRWFLKRAGGGDVVVLRASGSDGYNTYLHSGLGVAVNSVRTYVFRQRSGASDPAMLARLRAAEAIFLAGGDQSKYVRLWRDTPVQQTLQAHIEAGKPMGGTSAGLAVLGEVAYAALHSGDLTSALALRKPGHHWITLTRGFLRIPLLEGILTDTHFSERRRLGRLMVMLTKAALQWEQSVLGLGIDEATALCIEGDGSARVLRGDTSTGKVHVVMMAAPDPAMLQNRFGPQVAEVVSLGPDSTFNLATRSIENPAQHRRVKAGKGRLLAQEIPPAENKQDAPDPRPGSLIIVGGALRSSNEAVHEALIKRGRLREGGRLGILPAASSHPARSAREFSDALIQRGVPAGNMTVLPLAVKNDDSTPEVDESTWAARADDADLARTIRNLDAVWLTGGDQARIMQLLQPSDSKHPTPVGKAVAEMVRTGGVLGGTSAGAAVQSEVMILGGSSPGALRYGVKEDYNSMDQQEQGAVVLGKGLGLFPFGIIDQHFDRKARLGRLLVALAASESAHGYGIDEDTALVVDLADRSARVVGSGSVVVADLSAAEVTGQSFSDVRLCVLAQGDRLRWPGPQFRIHPDKQPTRDQEYMNIPDPQAFGPLHPYSGRIADILGFLLADNQAAASVPSQIRYPDGHSIPLRFSTDAQTRGFWASLDGQMPSYSVLQARLDISAAP